MAHKMSRRESDNPNWGGARKGGGRPKEITGRLEDTSFPMLMMIRIPGKMWNEFKELAPSEFVQTEEDSRQMAAIIMLDGMLKYIRSAKRAKAKRQQGE
jgi:hypothetical protein